MVQNSDIVGVSIDLEFLVICGFDGVLESFVGTKYGGFDVVGEV